MQHRIELSYSYPSGICIACSVSFQYDFDYIL